MKGTLLSLCLLLLQIFAMAQSGSIKGTVFTADHKPAGYVTIGIKGSHAGAITDEQGQYKFEKVKAGSYILKISAVGVQSMEQSIQLAAGETLQVPDIVLQESASELQEVVVNGLKKGYKAENVSPTLRIKTPLLEIPQNIQVVNSKLLADQQVFDMLEGVTRNVSGVTRGEHWDNYALIYTRGTQIPALRDGMNVSMPWGPLTEDMSFVDRVEFIKGPAGFMLANAEPGGMYNVVTKKPTGINRREVTFTAGSFDTYRATADVDGKVDSKGKLLYRLNVMGQKKGSFIPYDFNDRVSVAPVLKYNFTDHTSLTLEYDYQFSRMRAPGAAYQYSAKGFKDVPRNWTTASPDIDPTNINDHRVFLAFNHSFNSKWSLTTQLAYFNYRQVGSSLWPRAIDEAGNMQRGIGIWDALGKNAFGQVFVNGDVRTGSVTHRILAGVDLGIKDYWADFSQNAPLDATSSFNIYNPNHSIPHSNIPVFDRSIPITERTGIYVVSQKYASLYVQDELQFFNDKLRLTLAGRYTASTDANDAGSSSTDDKKFTPRVGLSASLDKQTSVYAVYDQAFVPQPGRDRAGNRFKPVTGDSYEIGFKRDWFGGRWNSTVALYHYTKNNVLTGDPNDPSHIYSIQIGGIRANGVEVDVKGELAKGLDLMLNYAYTDSRIAKDTANSKTIGNITPGVTRHVTNAWLSYRLPAGRLKGFGVSLGYQYQIGRYAWYVFDGSEQQIPDYFRLDGSISWQNKKYSIALNVNNILNDYLFSGAPYAFGSTKAYYWVSEAPRNFRVSVGYRF